MTNFSLVSEYSRSGSTIRTLFLGLNKVISSLVFSSGEWYKVSGITNNMYGHATRKTEVSLDIIALQSTAILGIRLCILYYLLLAASYFTLSGAMKLRQFVDK